jgi:exosortase
MVEAVARDGGRLEPSKLIGMAPLVVAGIALGVPTILRLGQQVWSQEFGAHGPIVLATGLWLLWRRLPDLKENGRTGSVGLTLVLAIMALAIYAFGRAFDLISLETAGVYGFAVAVLYDRFGLSALRRNWFPIFYLALLLPVPGWMLDEFTAPLKLLVSSLSEMVVRPLGVPLYREGVTMIAGPYQLLVEDACSGLNSLVGLIAITMFYIYLLRDAGWRYSLFLVCLIIPIAIAANVVRIVTLILLTYYMGDAVGQGFLHVTAGLFLFALSLLLMFLIDSVVSRFWRHRNAA